MLDIINNTSPILAAFLLGLLFSFDPCPMLTNIAAIGYVSRDISDKKRLFFRGMYYVLGRILALGILSFVLIWLLKMGGAILHLEIFFSQYGEIILIPVMIIAGLLLFFSDKITWLKVMFSAEKFEKRNKNDNFGAFLLGFLLSFGFCPTNAILFFGILIPMSASVSFGYFLPLIFAFATALPVVLVAGIMAFSLQNIDKLYKITDKYGKIIIKILGIIFVLIGVYLLFENILEL
ncbi:MAG: aromatic aminobenezylarsenical efflux permease ArsG family transporter [Prevotellaceae bacterium]|jgi:cytochrome c biogenesis protein CcdA|nr:aromatic aminobenezylarsenical efflux permease ArsG family transporter [Prevotellaceae bacterium]